MSMFLSYLRTAIKRVYRKNKGEIDNILQIRNTLKIFREFEKFLLK